MLIGVVLMVFIYNYDDFTVFLVKFSGSEDKLQQFRASFLTPQKFIILRAILLIIAALYGLLFFFIRPSQLVVFINEIKKDAILVCRDVLEEIRSFSFSEKIIVSGILLFITGVHLFYFFRLPMFIDEAFSYVHFVSKGFLISASYYPGPNNHFFYSELCVLTDLFFDDPVLVMRLPAFVSGLILSTSLFLVLKKYLGFKVALLSIIIFSLSEQINFYSSQGRGYMLFSLFVFLSFYSLGQFLFNARKFYLLLFVVSSVLGFYTIPVFLYPFSSMFLWSLFVIWKKHDRPLFFKTFALYFSIVVLVLILYLPVFLVNPPEVIFGNPWVSSPADFYSRFPQYLLQLNNFWWSDNFSLLFSSAALAGLIWLGAKNNISIVVAIILLFFFPWLMIFIQKVLPFERVWLYYLLFLSVGLSYLIINLICIFTKDASWQKKIAIACTIVVLVFFTFFNYRILEQETFSYYKELDKFFAKIDSMHLKNKNIQVTDADYNTFMRFHAIEKKNQLRVISSRDEITKPDLLIMPKDQPLQDSSYIFLFQNSYVKAYKAPD
jgi:hypothetical protein